MTVINPNSISGITSITLPSGDGNVLTIHTNDGTERFRIDSSGNVKVGTAATISPDGDVFFTGVTTVTTFTGAHSGSGANLTSLPAAQLTGTLPAITAANLTNIPAANIVGVCTSGLTKTGGFGGGKVLQIVQRYDSSFTRNAHASATYADTAHYVEITPTAASSKILVNISGACNNNGSGNTIYMDIYSSINGSSFASISPNGSSVPTAGFTLNKGDDSRNEIPMNIMYLDSPSYSLGNAITYKLYMRNNGSGSVEVPSNPGGEPVMCLATEIAA